jgi:hypothetical protein
MDPAGVTNLLAFSEENRKSVMPIRATQFFRFSSRKIKRFVALAGTHRMLTQLVNRSVSPGTLIEHCRCLNHDVWQTNVYDID